MGPPIDDVFPIIDNKLDLVERSFYHYRMNTKNTYEIRNKLLAVTESLIYQYGIHATGMEQIVKETGISRKTIYRYFSNKDDLCAQALLSRDERWMKWFTDSSLKGENPEACILEMFHALKSWFMSGEFRGCAFINATGEISDPTHPIRIIAKEHQQKIFSFIQQLTEKLDVNKPLELARQLLVLIDGAITAAMMMNAPSVADDAKEAARLLINNSLIQR
ncbi:TetR family transcriptional regulator [Xenorhabdus szentirmaii]|uniref:Transcriptional regulator, TetR family n=2 Tax=Xenorhabdus szentirmaii TaxID=290112 RepID=W1IPZ0_9GAMM|nr:TetR family transcriptional regulator [Xenorhabdus szentirmaii DSM 16338]PHM41108.1 TetR family transcriptional regulator [Xenorhabdus szentirmaii]CDL80557.1 putative transcriptional regulator, TetR family [Xenorhabdus szentirmaii DSM 16338]